MFADIEVKDRYRMNVGGPVIYVCNHLANLDPPIVASVLPRRALFLAKREIFNNPLLTFLLKGWGAYPVNRYSADTRALRWVRAMLGHDRAVVMFPEGTRSRNLEGLKQGRVGTALVAAQTGATLVPIGIHGTDDLQNILKVFMPIAKIRISVGEPFKVHPSVSSRSELQLATDEIMARVALQLPEERRGVYILKVESSFELTHTESAPMALGQLIEQPKAEISSQSGRG